MCFTFTQVQHLSNEVFNILKDEPITRSFQQQSKFFVAFLNVNHFKDFKHL